MSKATKDAVTIVVPSDSPSYISNFKRGEDVLFGDDLYVKPVLFPIGEGDKLNYVKKVFGFSRKMIEQKAKRFRIFTQTEANATIYVYMPALSAIISHDWRAFCHMQDGRFDTEEVRAHMHRVQQREAVLRKKDLLIARAAKPKKIALPVRKQVIVSIEPDAQNWLLTQGQ